MAGVNGKWKTVSSDGDAVALLKASGMADDAAKAAAAVLAPGMVEELQFSEAGGRQNVLLEGQTPDSSNAALNKQHDTKSADGRDYKVKFVLESPNKMVRYDDFGGGKVVTATHERVGDNLIVTLSCGGQTVVRKMEKA